MISSEIWASQTKKQPSQATDGKLLGILTHMVSENTQSALRKEQGWDSFAAVLPTPSYSSMYEAMCVKEQILRLKVTIITALSMYACN